MDISFRISGLTESSKWKGMLKTRYTNTMKNPYKIALDTPFFSLGLPPFLVKKLTVSGIIGNTHGVSSANNPPKNPSPKIFQSELLDAFIS